ncbi:MAG: hypothetical protein ACK4UN_13285 [Limisphaerales bacterium]
MINTPPDSATDLMKGQTWQLTGSSIEIGTIGKRLVHYKHLRTNAKRANTSLTSIRELKAYLRDNGATLQPQ